STSRRACTARSSRDLATEVEGGLRHPVGEVEAVRGRVEELLEEREDGLLVGRRGGADRYRHPLLTLRTSRKPSSVTSSTRATSASPSAAERNQLWCGWRYTPRAAHAAAKVRLRSKEP